MGCAHLLRDLPRSFAAPLQMSLRTCRVNPAVCIGKLENAKTAHISPHSRCRFRPLFSYDHCTEERRPFDRAGAAAACGAGAGPLLDPPPVDRALSAGLSARLTEMRARLQRLGDRAEKKRSFTLKATVEAEIKTLVAPDFTASLRRGAPTLDVLAEERIPLAYWKAQPPKLDRQGLLSALKDGGEIDGAALAAPETQLSVRTK
jgi:hypothetical protein